MVIVKKLRRAMALLRPTMELLRHHGKKKLVIELAMAGELPFILPILKNATELPGIRLILMPAHDHDLVVPQVSDALRPIGANFSVMRRDDIQSLGKWIRFDGLVTSEQFSEPLFRPAVCVFHGHPSKGITFTKQVIERFDHFFHLGPIHRNALDEFVVAQEIDRESLPELHEIGYPKTDDLIRGSLTLEQGLFGDRLRPFDKVILYAPAFNEHCTLRTIGVELITTLASLSGACVIVKLAPDSIGQLDNHYATGGVDWRKQIESLELENVFVAMDLDIGPCIAVSDMMVTDVSGVGYEFLATGKPVIYFECLDFYEKVVLPKHPELTLDDLLDRDTMNGGRHYGTVVRSLDQLRDVLSGPLPGHSAEQLQKLLLYNPGNATKATMQTLARLFVS